MPRPTGPNAVCGCGCRYWGILPPADDRGGPPRAIFTSAAGSATRGPVWLSPPDIPICQGKALKAELDGTAAPNREGLLGPTKVCLIIFHDLLTVTLLKLERAVTVSLHSRQTKIDCIRSMPLSSINMTSNHCYLPAAPATHFQSQQLRTVASAPAGAAVARPRGRG